MDWYVVYKGRSINSSLYDNLEKAGIPYFIAKQTTEKYVEGKMVQKEEVLLKNLIFIQTDQNIYEITNSIDGLKAPYYNRATHTPAVIKEAEMKAFMDVLAAKSYKVQLLQDSYSKFTTGTRVRVKAGMFEGLEGHVLRMKGDRKLVIGLDDIAIAITGIHFTLLEPV